MMRFRPVSLALLLVVPGQPASPGPALPGGNARCEAVEGTISATARSVRITLRGLQLVGDATVEGSLAGMGRISARRLGSEGEEARLGVELRVRGPAGPVVLRGELRAGREADRRRPLHGRLWLPDVDGEAGGSIVTTGWADVGRRQIGAHYVGELCGLEGHAAR